jgi:hypothetical protein
MDTTPMPQDHRPSAAADRLRTISRYVFFGFAAIAAFFLITEHRAHLYGVLPFLLLAACPLLHFFHHGGHGHGGGESSSTSRRSDPPSSSGGAGHQH